MWIQGTTPREVQSCFPRTIFFQPFQNDLVYCYHISDDASISTLHFIYPLPKNTLKKVKDITNGLSADFSGTLKIFGVKIIAGMLAWGLIAPFLSAALFVVTLPIFKHLLAKKKEDT